jgi:hypothetical protein
VLIVKQNRVNTGAAPLNLFIRQRTRDTVGSQTHKTIQTHDCHKIEDSTTTRSIIMASKPNTTNVSLKALLSQATRTSAAILPPSRRDPFSKSSAKSDDATTYAREQKCCVRFNNKVAVRITLSRKDYTSEEVSAAWFNRDDYQRIRKECSKVIRKMKEERGGGMLKDKNYCAIGLERRTRTEASSKALNRVLAINGVLDEQMDQWMVCNMLY